MSIVRSLELYIYYRVPGADAARCVDAVRGWQCRHGADASRLHARMLVRREDGVAETTCMEVYRGAAVAEPGFGEWLDGEITALWAAERLPAVNRHREWFEPCA